MKQLYQAVIKLPFAFVGLRFDGSELVALDYLNAATEKRSSDPLVKQVCQQIEQYCQSDTEMEDFDIAIRADGTAFQRKVLQILMQIPYAGTLTYGEVAERIGTSARAVGNACRRNPIPLIIPCHRVVAANGIGGYDGDTEGGRLNIKRFLLQHERAVRQRKLAG